MRWLAGEGSRAVPTDTSVGLSHTPVLNEKDHPYLQCAVCSTYVVHTIWGWVWTSTPLLLSRKGVCCVYASDTVGIL